LGWGVGACVLLQIAFVFGILDSFSSLSDSPWKGMDYYTLPRCGLAFRNGTNVFESHKAYSWYADFGGFWASHPLLCAVLGAPLSYLPPTFGYHLLNTLFAVCQIAIVGTYAVVLGKNVTLLGLRDKLFLLFSGVSMPWYTMMNQGNYHVLCVLGLFWILQTEAQRLPQGFRVAGYALSAFGKPLLAPLGLFELLLKRWSVVLWTLLVVVLGTLPIVFLRPNADGSAFPYAIGLNETYLQFLKVGEGALTSAAHRWNQIQSVHALLAETPLSPWNFEVRLFITFILFGTALWCSLVRKRHLVAFVMVPIWYLVMNARGHEYHWTLLTPILLCLYAQFKEYRDSWILAVLLLTSLPNGWFLFHLIADFEVPNQMENTQMISLSPFLYSLFLVPKPLAPLLLLGRFVWIEMRMPRVTKN
jgi:hypothetical protein